MVKAISFFFLLLGTAYVSKAQSYEASILGGLNFSQFDGDGFGGYNKLGLHTGIRISRLWKGPWSWGFEIDYTQKGSKKVLDPDQVDFSTRLNYHYLEVPFLALYDHTEKLQLHTGLSVGVLVHNEEEYNGIVTETEDIRSSELGFHLGAGYTFSDRWQLQLRHSYSLASVRDQGLIYNNMLQFGFAGWYHNLFTASLLYELGQ